MPKPLLQHSGDCRCHWRAVFWALEMGTFWNGITEMAEFMQTEGIKQHAASIKRRGADSNPQAESGSQWAEGGMRHAVSSR